MIEHNLKSLRAEYQVTREISGRFFLTLATDHPRLFKLKNGDLLLVCSNYRDNAPGLLKSHGFTEYDPIYTSETTTFIKRFKNRRELNRELIQIDELRNKKNAVGVFAETSDSENQKTYIYSNAKKCNVKFSGRRSYSGKGSWL